MKYVSPQTEQRRKQAQKRKKQMMMYSILAAVIIIAAAGIAVVFSMMNKENSMGTSSVSQTDSTQSQEQISSESVQNTPSPSPESAQTDENKEGILDKIFSFFSFGKSEESKGFPATSFGKTVYEPAKSIISLSPMATEFILSSPSQNNLIGVTEYCDKRGLDIETVGTPLIPKADKIIQLAPDYLIVQNPLSEKDRIDIEQSGIIILQMNTPKTFEELQEVYRSLTALTLGADKATQISAQIVSDIQQKLSLYQNALSSVQKKSAVLLYNKYGMVATNDTFDGEILSYFFNINVSGSNYMAQSVESIAQSNPDVIIAADTITAEDLAAMGFENTSAYQSGNIFYVPIQEFENLSAKTILTLSGIANTVYGDAIKPAPTPAPEE